MLPLFKVMYVDADGSDVIAPQFIRAKTASEAEKLSHKPMVAYKKVLSRKKSEKSFI